MNSDVHSVRAKWREADAAALDERVIGINDWLDHTEDLIAMFEFNEDDKLPTELQSVAGLVRSRRNDLVQASDALKATLMDTVRLALHTAAGPLA
jgi:hypothetical protein